MLFHRAIKENRLLTIRGDRIEKKPKPNKENPKHITVWNK